MCDLQLVWVLVPLVLEKVLFNVSFYWDYLVGGPMGIFPAVLVISWVCFLVGWRLWGPLQ